MDVMRPLSQSGGGPTRPEPCFLCDTCFPFPSTSGMGGMARSVPQCPFGDFSLWEVGPGGGFGCVSPKQVGHARGGAKSLHVTPILDQWVSTEASKGFAFTSARPCAHLATWTLMPLSCMLQPPRWILGHLLQGAVFTAWAKLPPRLPHESGAPWCLHFTDLEKSDSCTVTKKSGPVGCHPLSKRQLGLGLAKECQGHCTFWGWGWVTKTGAPCGLCTWATSC